MRIAFADLIFSWPPTGGADVDLYHTVSGLQATGHEVRVFVAGLQNAWDRGDVDPEDVPFPLTRHAFPPRFLNRHIVPYWFGKEIDAWQPDLVFVCDGFFLKPYVIEALAAYPLIGRYYAYEIDCMRDSLLYKDDAPCPAGYLRTPDLCRKCALKHLGPSIKFGPLTSWAREFVAAKAYRPGYREILVRSLKQLKAIVVYNEVMAAQVRGINPKVYLIPGGVDAATFSGAPLPERAAGDRKVILMTGRVEDPMKGLETLLAAGELLAKQRRDFEVWVTHCAPTLNSEWLKVVGWHDRERLPGLYRQADICVVPSLWEEPFGLVAVEAMASGRPVCASRVGGLQGIVRHGETGFLFERRDAPELARRLAELLDDVSLRGRMGAAGRRVAEMEYDWPRIIETHYPALFERVMA